MATSTGKRFQVKGVPGDREALVRAGVATSLTMTFTILFFAYARDIAISTFSLDTSNNSTDLFEAPTTVSVYLVILALPPALVFTDAFGANRGRWATAMPRTRSYFLPSLLAVAVIATATLFFAPDGSLRTIGSLAAYSLAIAIAIFTVTLWIRLVAFVRSGDGVRFSYDYSAIDKIFLAAWVLLGVYGIVRILSS